MSFIETLIQLSYSKPGEDLKNSLVEDNDGNVDVKLTLTNIITLLKMSVTHLENINNLIPYDNTLDIYGSGQSIGMSGDNEVLEKLLDKGFVIEGIFEEDDENGIFNDDDSDSDNENCSEDSDSEISV